MLRRKRPRFNTVLTEAVQEGLNSIGPCISDAVLFYVQKKAGARPDQCDLDPEVYDSCFKAIFGWGAEIVEKKILERLYVKLEVKLRINSGFVFIDEVKRARKFTDSLDLSTDESSSRMGNKGKSAQKALTVPNR